MVLPPTILSGPNLFKTATNMSNGNAIIINQSAINSDVKPKTSEQQKPKRPHQTYLDNFVTLGTRKDRADSSCHNRKNDDDDDVVDDHHRNDSDTADNRTAHHQQNNHPQLGSADSNVVSGNNRHNAQYLLPPPPPPPPCTSMGGYGNALNDDDGGILDEHTWTVANGKLRMHTRRPGTEELESDSGNSGSSSNGCGGGSSSSDEAAVASNLHCNELAAGESSSSSQSSDDEEDDEDRTPVWKRPSAGTGQCEASVAPTDVADKDRDSKPDESQTSASPACDPDIMANYKTPHSQRRLIQQRKSKKRTKAGGKGAKRGAEATLSTEEPTQAADERRSVPEAIHKWAGCINVWRNMVNKEEATFKTRNCKDFQSRNAYLPRMRAILVDWIMEVCEVYRLHRNTYYLALDYIDRFLTLRPSVPKTQLQLLGVTCLFIAAKLEEIYPPKLLEFSYVCDGACADKDILTCEVLILNTLAWEVNPMTPTGWLNLYMQIHHDTERTSTEQLLQDATSRTYQFPAYSAYHFVRASHIIDLFSLDPGFVRFSYSVIAAAAVYFIHGEQVALAVSGLNWPQLELCVAYMCVFHEVLCDTDNPRLRSVTGGPTGGGGGAGGSSGGGEDDDRQAASLRAIRVSVPDVVRDEYYSLQTHIVDLDCFERAVLLRLELLGFHVEKTYMKRKRRQEDGDSDQQVVDDDSGDADQMVVMYEIEPVGELLQCIRSYFEITAQLSNDICATPSATMTADATTPPGTSAASSANVDRLNIFAIMEKTIVNFDDILASVHSDCPDELFLQRVRLLYAPEDK